jgi:hypothetical protein
MSVIVIFAALWVAIDIVYVNYPSIRKSADYAVVLLIVAFPVSLSVANYVGSVKMANGWRKIAIICVCMVTSLVIMIVLLLMCGLSFHFRIGGSI